MRIQRNVSQLGPLTFPECHRLAAWIRQRLTGPEKLNEVKIDGADEQTSRQILSLLSEDKEIWPVPSPVGGRLLFHSQQPMLPTGKSKFLTVEFEGRHYQIPLGRSRQRISELIDRDGDRCAWCGQVLSASHPYATVDHVIPTARCGTDTLDNLLLSCHSCNTERKHTSAITWMRICRARGQQVQEKLVWERLTVLLLS